MVVATDCNDIAVLVCPQAWVSKGGDPTTFEREWKNIEERQEAGGQYRPGHWAERQTTPVKLKAGDVIMWKGARPFRILSGTSNCSGFFLSWQTGTPKTITMTARADAVIEGIVIKKSPIMGYRYVNNKAATNATIPRDFGTLTTALTVNTVGHYASLIFGTNYAKQADWPEKYRKYASAR